MTAAPATSGIGSLNGIADQVSLPNILLLRGLCRPVRPVLIRAGGGRDALGRNVAEQRRIDRLERVRLYRLARADKLAVRRAVEGRAVRARVGDPFEEVRVRD